MSQRLSPDASISAGVRLPVYRPEAHGIGIVHLGLGAFHKAHQAVYTDDALAAEGGDWRIAGISLRSKAAASELAPQGGRYTLIERGPEGTKARIIGSIAEAIAASADRASALRHMTAPTTQIVSLTVTEKAYGIDRASGGIDAAHPAIRQDLAAPGAATGVLGLLVEALRARRDAGAAPFTVLCCDNLPDNGAFLRAGLIDMARHLDPELAGWIEGEVAFPSTMVDRITPVATDETRQEALRLTGCADHAAIATEPFTQWVIEDAFTGPRPAWEAGGALFVKDVTAYEHMKLRMLNGAHSMIAYAGFLNGCTFVGDVMADRDLAALVGRHLAAAAATLAPLPGVDFADYAQDLLARFSNPTIEHATYQIAMDGTEKLPQRLLAPAAEVCAAGDDPGPFAFAVACWMRYCLGRTEDGETHALRDPREDQMREAVKGAQGAAGISAELHALPGLFPASLREESRWRSAVERHLDALLRRGVATAIADEARTIA